MDLVKTKFNLVNQDARSKLKSYGGYPFDDGMLYSFLNNPNLSTVLDRYGDTKAKAMKKYLKDFGLLSKDNSIDEDLILKMRHIYISNNDLFWQLIWVNLIYNSPIVLYVLSICQWEDSCSLSNIFHGIEKDYNLKKTTVRVKWREFYSIINASPYFKKMVSLTEQWDGLEVSLNNMSIHPYTLVYSLIKYSENRSPFQHHFTVSDLINPKFDKGMYHIFGIQKMALLSTIRSLSLLAENIINSETNYGLENINLLKQLSPNEFILSLKL